jgi:hypothetical protein
VLVVVAFMGLVSAWLPFLDSRIMARWFDSGHFWWLAPVPLLAVANAFALWRAAMHQGRDAAPFVLTLSFFVLGFAGEASNRMRLAGSRRCAPGFHALQVALSERDRRGALPHCAEVNFQRPGAVERPKRTDPVANACKKNVECKALAGLPAGFQLCWGRKQHPYPGHARATGAEVNRERSLRLAQSNSVEDAPPGFAVQAQGIHAGQLRRSAPRAHAAPGSFRERPHEPR